MIFNYPVLKDGTLSDFLNDFHLSKSKIYTLFLESRIQVNDKECQKNTFLKKGDKVSIEEKETIDFICENKKLDILYEDDYLLIVNKPAHILVHPDDKNKGGSLCNVVANYYKNKGYDLSVKYAHRLDMDTTGILIFCKDMLSMAYMNEIISKHEMKRYYRCFISGRIKKQKDTIALPIGEDRHHNSRRRVSKTGQMAITHYEILKEFKEYSLAEVLLETGRTHQIRVHFSHLGHPLLGDVLYNGNCKFIHRVALHSYKVEFIHPVYRRSVELVKELPYDMKKLWGENDVNRKTCK